MRTTIRRTRGLAWRRFGASIGLAAVTLGLLATPSAAQETGPTALASVLVDSRHVPPGGQFIPAKVGSGDADFKGHGPRVVVDASLNIVGSTVLTVKLCMGAIETVPDFTEANSCSGHFGIYQAPPGQCIQSVSIGARAGLNYLDTDHALDEFNGPAGTFVSKWEVTGDTKGNEAGTKTGVNIFTRPFFATIAPC